MKFASVMEVGSASLLAGKSKAEIIAPFRKAAEIARQEAKQEHSAQRQPQMRITKV